MKPKPHEEALCYRVSTYVTEADLLELEQLCKTTQTSKSQILRTALRELLNNEGVSIPKEET